MKITNLRQQAEETLGKQQSAEIPTTGEDTLRLVHELQVHQIELEMQNEELVQARAEAEAVHRQYTDLFDIAPVGYFTLTRDGAISQVNLTGATLLGAEAERGKLLNKRFGLFVSPKSLPIFAALLEKVFVADGEKQTCEVGLLTSKTESFWAQIEAAYDEAHETCRAVVVDITERKQAEETLRDSEARYRALFQGTGDGILIADLETRVFRYANPAACRLLGYSEAELRTMGVADIHPKADLPAVLAEFEAQARGDKTLAADLPCLRKDGTIVHADVSAVAMSVDGRACSVGFFRDITERRQAEEQLNEQLDELRRWHKATLGREMRVLDLKREVNELLAQTGLPPRYHSPEAEVP